MRKTFGVLPVSGALALATHRFVKTHEPDAALFVATWIVTYWTLTIALYVSGQPLVDAVGTTMSAALTFLGTLATSILVRRTWLHPLSSYPGPPMARLSRLWNVAAVLSTKQVLIVQKLHEQYGEVVRIGPNELSFASVEAIPVVLGAEGRLNRGPWYIFLSRSVGEHIRLRRMWEKALGPAATRAYLSHLNRALEELIVILSSDASAEPVDLSNWISRTLLQWMGQLGFEGDFALDSEDGVLHTVRETIGFVNVVGQMPWLKPILALLPHPTEMRRYKSLASKTVASRATGSKDDDLLRFLLGEDNGKPQMRDRIQLYTQQFFLLLGGEAISTTTNVAVYNILAHPPYVKQLRAELESTSESHPETLRSQLAQLPFLNACIKESLRLAPPFPAAPRTVGREGAWICGRFVKGGTTVGIPTFTLHHSSAHFAPAPDAFLPERWLSPQPIFRKPFNTSLEPFVHDTQAFLPFGLGSFACPGADLTFDAIRLLLRSLILTFDMTLATGGRTPAELDAKFRMSMRDNFLLTAGTVSVYLKPRG